RATTRSRECTVMRRRRVPITCGALAAGGCGVKASNCEPSDSNRHTRGYWNLNPARLPIPPGSRGTERIMARVMSLRSLWVLACGLVVAGCLGPRGPVERHEATASAAKAGPAKPVAGPLGRVRDDLELPLTALLGQPIAAVEARLGEPLGKGMARSSCVRFVPERVFFTCEFALQRYGDPTGTWTGVRVEFEDGVATGVGFDGWKHGDGPVDPARL